MIEIKNLTKTFGKYNALDNLNCVIEDETIYGLIGPNGAGKSTLLRLISGVYKADIGEVLVNSKEVFENVDVKNEIFYLSDELYFLPQSTMNSMADFYSGYYENFSFDVYKDLCGLFPLNPKSKIATFSKGMQRQAGLILAISTNPKILLLDEAFDGLDPMIRSAVRKILIDLVAKNNITVIISSHNLRELEDLCDHIGLIHKGGIMLDRDIDTLRLNICKIQCAFKEAPSREEFNELEMLKFSSSGNLLTIVARGDYKKAQHYIENKFSPIFIESIPLTLEEVFIHEMEVVGYDFSKITYLITCFITLYLPAIAIFVNRNIEANYIDPTSMYMGVEQSEYVFSLSPFIIYLLPLFAFILPLTQFVYLTNKRAMDVYASIPIKRESTITSKILAGATLILLPPILMMIASFITNIIFVGFEMILLYELLFIIFETIVFLLLPYMIVVFVSTLSGTLAENILYSIILLITPFIIYGAYNLVLELEIYGFVVSDNVINVMGFTLPYWGYFENIMQNTEIVTGLTNEYIYTINNNVPDSLNVTDGFYMWGKFSMVWDNNSFIYSFY